MAIYDKDINSIKLEDITNLIREIRQINLK